MTQKRIPWSIVIPITLIIIFVIITVAIVSIRPLMDDVTNRYWCVDEIAYDGRECYVHSIGIKLVGVGMCKEDINFRKAGRVSLPGLNTMPIEAFWTIEKNNVRIYHTDTFESIYAGSYTVDVSGDSLILRSPNTLISCHLQEISIPALD